MLEKISQYPFNVQPAEVDFRGKASLTTISHYLLEAARTHADDRQFGVADLMKVGKTWVLTRLKIEMERYPALFEKIVVESWIQDIGELFTTRNFWVFDGKGKKIGEATSTWAAIDWDTRRPHSLSFLTDAEDYRVTEVNRHIDPASKIDRISTASRSLEDAFKVRYSDLDLNKHVNSVRYIQWIADLFPISFYKEASIRSFNINYLREALYGHQIEAFLAIEKEGGNYLIELIDGDTKKAVCRGELAMNNEQ